MCPVQYIISCIGREIAGGVWVISSLLGDEQIFRERPFAINPLRVTVKAGLLSKLEWLLRSILVAAFGPDGLAWFESEREIGGRNSDGLKATRTDVHLHASCF